MRTAEHATNAVSIAHAFNLHLYATAYAAGWTEDDFVDLSDELEAHAYGKSTVLIGAGAHA